MYVTGSYVDESTPVEFGNMINIVGYGAGQLLCEWTRNSNVGHLYYRSHRDLPEAWSDWNKIAFISDTYLSNNTELIGSSDESTMYLGFDNTRIYLVVYRSIHSNKMYFGGLFVKDSTIEANVYHCDGSLVCTIRWDSSIRQWVLTNATSNYQTFIYSMK